MDWLIWRQSLKTIISCTMKNKRLSDDLFSSNFIQKKKEKLIDSSWDTTQTFEVQPENVPYYRILVGKTSL